MLLLVGCSGAGSEPQAAVSTPIPTTVGGTVPVPTVTLSSAPPTDAAVPPELPEEATAPPPATAGPLTARNLPTPEKLGTGWKTYVDPGGVEEGFLGNKTWTRKRAAHQAAFEALPLGCAGKLPTGSLPVPQYALQGAYRTADAQPATALLLRFADPAKAAAYRTGYQARMTACGSGGDLSVTPLWSEDSAAASVRRYAGAEAYADVSVLQGSTVALLAAASIDKPAAWAHSVVPALEAVVDSP
ncbi:hypothetical protein EV646_117172 [Kribbella antiqua]|uniref:PknH-like protein n=1 Tax=Kribbella antiqua TaxID=2512217 RepID=A0A4R2I8E0_9ACTN|nr:hypothetical protein EV646_117172 [Kribbella antiqua]